MKTVMSNDNQFCRT